MGTRRVRVMTDQRATEIERELASIARCERSKRDARKLLGPTPADLIEYDAWMNRWIERGRARIARLTAGGMS
jgi:hypothetical protein